MRVAVVTESFLPTVNGVAGSVARVLRHLAANGHEAMLICPAAGSPDSFAGFPVHQLPALAYRQFPIGLPNPAVQRLIAEFAPAVLHAASPFFLGGQALAAAARLGIPSVAVYQTDIAGYAKRHRLGAAANLAWRVLRWAHGSATVTLVPSTAAAADLRAAGIGHLRRWGRGVDLDLFHPNNRTLQSAHTLRRRLSPNGEVVVGYVGRIAPEKQVERLAELRGIAGARFAIVGDGPSTARVARSLRGMPVDWLGRLGGQALADAYAAFDVFAHTGVAETFGQTIQEAHAAGLPVVAPRAGGPIDLVTDASDGYLYNPADPSEFRDLVEDLVVSPRVRIRMGETGRRTVLTRSWSAVCSQLVAHYESVIHERTGASATPLPDL